MPIKRRVSAPAAALARVPRHGEGVVILGLDLPVQPRFLPAAQPLGFNLRVVEAGSSGIEAGWVLIMIAIGVHTTASVSSYLICPSSLAFFLPTPGETL